jgi:Ca-activated chloride channel family protein
MGEIAMFSFAAPWMILFIFLPPLVRFLKPVAKADTSDTPELAFPYIERLNAVFPRQAPGRRKPPRLYYLTAALLWLGLTGALMQPQLIDQYTQVRNKGYDLMLAVDLSGSMRALDFSSGVRQINRLDVIKAVVGDFVGGRKGDRIGLILFGDKAYMHVPLTLDTDSVVKMLDNTLVGEAGDSTAIGDAIGMAVANLRDRPEQSRVIILLTDGADNASTLPPLRAAKLAAQYNIKIYTIGVGSTGPVPIPDDMGRIVLARMDLDEDLLKNIAETTGGAYFRATDTQALQEIYRRIDQMEKTEAESRSYVIRQPLYRYPLGFALLMLLALALTPVIRRARHAG